MEETQVESFLWGGMVRSLVLMCPMPYELVAVGCSNIGTDYNSTQQRDMAQYKY